MFLHEHLKGNLRNKKFKIGVVHTGNSKMVAHILVKNLFFSKVMVLEKSPICHRSDLSLESL